MTLTITLDSVRKYRNPKEWRSVNRASCEGFESIGDGDNIKAVAKMLIAADYPPNQAVSVVRSGTTCFQGETLLKWASGTALSGDQPKHLRREKSE